MSFLISAAKVVQENDMCKSILKNDIIFVKTATLILKTDTLFLIIDTQNKDGAQTMHSVLDNSNNPQKSAPLRFAS